VLAPGIPIAPRRYAWHSGALLLTSSPARALAASLTLGAGQFFDGARYDLDPSLVVRAGPHWLVSLGSRNAWLEFPSADTSVHTAFVRLAWQATPDFVASALAQWRSDSDRVGIQLRIHWIVEPGRDVYLVVTQDVLDVDADARRGATEAVAKAGFTFRF